MGGGGAGRGRTGAAGGRPGAGRGRTHPAGGQTGAAGGRTGAAGGRTGAAGGPGGGRHELGGGPGGTGGLELLSPLGRELLDRLSGEDVTPDRALVLAEELRRSYPPPLVAAALTQQSLRMSGRAKFRHAGAMLFTRPGLEQASSEAAAAHSARRYEGFSTVADLCCGIGGNLAALAARTAVLAVDRDLTSLEFARHNAAACGAAHPVGPVCADVRQLAAGRARPGAIFIDPARRSGDRRLRAGSSEPALDWCLALPDWVPAVGIKAAPGLPHELIPPGWEAEFLAVGRSLKEALLWSPALATASRRATILPAGGPAWPAGPARPGAPALPGHPARPGDTLVPEPGPPVPVAAPGAYLLDPNPAVTRAGLVEDLARRIGAWKIDPMIAFLAADEPVATPFARTLRVLESMPWNEKQVARRVRELGITAADIRRRGLAGDVSLIHRRLGLRANAPAGGGAADALPSSAVIVMTRRDDKPWGLISVPA
jgi:SAM-dependent methyltransferase